MENLKGFFYRLIPQFMNRASSFISASPKAFIKPNRWINPCKNASRIIISLIGIFNAFVKNLLAGCLYLQSWQQMEPVSDKHFPV
jgi:hypothetical protein